MAKVGTFITTLIMWALSRIFAGNMAIAALLIARWKTPQKIVLDGTKSKHAFGAMEHTQTFNSTNPNPERSAVMADETEMTRGRAAYEAAAKVSGCDQPWAEANQPKWETAAEAVRDTAIIECLQVVKDLADQAEGFNHTVQAASYRRVEIHLRGLRR